jgi:hypothetical protein
MEGAVATYSLGNMRGPTRCVTSTLIGHPVDRFLHRKYSRGLPRLLLRRARCGEIRSAVYRFLSRAARAARTAPQVLEEPSNSIQRVAPQRD